MEVEQASIVWLYIILLYDNNIIYNVYIYCFVIVVFRLHYFKVVVCRSSKEDRDKCLSVGIVI